MSAERLTGKQEAFINAYFESGFNATEAARRAGYSGNDGTLAVIGYENLRKPHIDSRIRARMDEHAMTANEVLFHLAEIARGDFGELVDDNGNPDVKSAKDKGKSRLIKRIRTRTFTTEDSDVTENELEPYDRLKALELLARHHKLLTDKVQIDDWQSQAVEDIRAGRLQYQDLANAFDTDLATTLFARAGVPVSTRKD